MTGDSGRFPTHQATELKVRLPRGERLPRSAAVEGTPVMTWSRSVTGCLPAAGEHQFGEADGFLRCG